MSVSIELADVSIAGGYAALQLKEVKTTTDENGAVISQKIHRRCINPGDDVSSESDEVKALVAEHHTAAIVDAYTNR